MKSVKLNFLLIFFLTFGLSYQGYADCPIFVESNTEIEAAANKTGKGLKNFFSFNWSNLDFDEKLLQYIRVTAIKDQGVDGYFNPKIQVCDYEGKDNCYILPSGTSCRQIYGTQDTGGGVSAAVFIDWEGDKTSVNAKIADSLEWEWADNVTDEEKTKFAKSPKICACSQKGACMGSSAWFSRVLQGENIFRPGDMENVCDTCSSWSKGKQKIKCAPVPLAPGPPPFCKQLAMSPPQVRIIPIKHEDNDYFDPKVKVIIGDLKGRDGKIGKKLDFPKGYGEDKAEWRSILDKDGMTHYFKTYRKKGQLCAEYLETEESNKKPQFIRCFPAPPAPEPKILRIVDANTLEIEMKMSESTCIYRAHGVYSNGLCTFNVNAGSSTNIGLLSLKVVKPRIVKKTTNSNNNKSNIGDVIEGIFNKSSQFEILKQHNYIPNIGIELPPPDGDCTLTGPKEDNKCQSIKLELDNMGQPKIEVRYMQIRDQANSNRKMLCLSGWQPEPEEFVLKRGDEIIPLKLMGTKYIKYNAVYSKESNRFYYLPSKKRETVDLLKGPQDQLDKIIFNKQGYVFFPDDNKQEKGKCSYCVNYDKDIDEQFTNNKVKVVYKLMDAEHREECKQGDDGCICSDGECSRSKQYLNKEDGETFYLRYEEVDCKDKDGKTLKNNEGEVQKCTQLKDQLIKANRTEVFYADKLCRLDLEGLEENLEKTIKKQLKYEEQKPGGSSQISCKSEGNVCTGGFSQYDYIEIEAWGSGEAGHIQNTAHSTESRPGIPGDYIKIKLKIDPSYPVIMAEIKQAGGNREGSKLDKNGESTSIKKCDLGMNRCDNLITIAGGGTTDKTMIHGEGLELEKIIIKGNERQSTQDNQIAYIENGEIKYETVKCSSGFRSSKPGAGGCIDRNSQTYGRGSPGYVKIGSVQINYKKVKEVIDALIKDPESNVTVSRLIRELYPNIIEKIKEEIKKELLE